MGHAGMGWVMQGLVWGRVGHIGVGQIMQGCGRSCRGVVGHTGVEWAVKIFTE